MDDVNLIDGPLDLSAMGIREYESLFRQYYQWLCLQAFKIADDWHASEDIVQEFFVKCWQNRASIHIRESWKAFACRSVKNSALNYLKKENTRIKHETASHSTVPEAVVPLVAPINESDERYLRLLMAISQLPEQRKKVFLLSRQEMKYADIAKELGISINTVKMHLRLAYQELRNALRFLIILFL